MKPIIFIMESGIKMNTMQSVQNGERSLIRWILLSVVTDFVDVRKEIKETSMICCIVCCVGGSVII